MLQEGALLMLNLIDSYDPERRIPFPAYLRAQMHYGIHNLARAQRRTLYTPAPLGEREPLDPNPGPDTQLEQKDIRRRLIAALNTLSPLEKEFIHCHYVEGWTMKKTAECLKISYKSARTLKKNILQKLKKKL
jgi:RNA polymerase sigma factor (sigma-70 family)